MPIGFWRNVLVMAIGWLVGVSVALAGAIGFIGLVIPHMLRLCGFTDHRTLLPASAVAGAATLLVADIIARLALTAGAADWRGDRHAGRAGVYLATIKSRTLKTTLDR